MATARSYLVNHNADNALVTLRYRFKDAQFEAAEEPFEAAGHEIQSRLVHHSQRQPKANSIARLANSALKVYAVDAAPSVKTHPIKAAAHRA